MIKQFQNLLSPISQLDDGDISDVLAHLKRLSPDDRYKRFFAVVGDQTLEKYCSQMLDFKRGAGFGVFSSDKKSLIGFAHVSAEESVNGQLRAELGISVDAAYRGRGLAERLLRRSLVHCSAKNIDLLFMSCLHENAQMQHLARKCGLTVLSDRGEVMASLNIDGSLPSKITAASQDMLYRQISIMDKCYRNNSFLLAALFQKDSFSPEVYEL